MLYSISDQFTTNSNSPSTNADRPSTKTCLQKNYPRFLKRHEKTLRLKTANLPTPTSSKSGQSSLPIFLLTTYDEENGDHNLVGLIWSTIKYMATHHGVLAFHSPTSPSIYDPIITDDDKPAVVRKNKLHGKLV